MDGRQMGPSELQISLGVVSLRWFGEKISEKLFPTYFSFWRGGGKKVSHPLPYLISLPLQVLREQVVIYSFIIFEHIINQAQGSK